MLKTSSGIYYFNTDLHKSALDLKDRLVQMLYDHNVTGQEIIILCIGSDRSTGDSLGPLVGYKLNKYQLPNVYVYGTLHDPVHAANLRSKINQIMTRHQSPFIIAIDASLGTMEHVGYVTLCDGPLKPGLGVNKELPSVGDIHLTGIVNFSGMMESLLLQTTRLSKVMNLADTIAKSILYGLMEFQNR